MVDLDQLARIAEVEFSDIVQSVMRIEQKLRIILVEGSFLDVFLSQKLKNRFGFHWETKNKEKPIYRYDNYPDKKWQKISTYPYHFHNGSQENAQRAPFPKDPLKGFEAFMNFVRDEFEKPT